MESKLLVSMSYALLDWFKLVYAPYTQNLPRTTRKESNVPKLKNMALEQIM